MKLHPYRASVTLERASYSTCRGCEAPLSGCTRYSFPWVRELKGQRHITVYLCCDACADTEDALQEAEAEGRRFTKVFLKAEDRCLCGAAYICKIKGCIRCSIAQRMLTKVQQEHRLITGLMRELKREITAQNRAATMGK